MKKSDMAVFLLIVLGVYGAMNFYLLRRGAQALSGHPALRIAFFAVLGAGICAYPLGRILNGASRGPFSDVLIRSGSFYMALMLHALVLLALIDFVRLANAVFGFVPGSWIADFRKTGLVLFIAMAGIAAATVVGGYLNALHPRLRTFDAAIDKPAGDGRKSLNVVLASDIHLGTIMGSRRLETIVDRINRLDPDIVLFPGDIVDESVSRDEEERMTTALRAIRAPLGVFSVTGNHEYYGGFAKNMEYLGRGGVRVLQDEAVMVAGAFVVAGRNDPTALRFGGTRIPIPEILEKSGIDGRSLPLLLLDHQPIRLSEAEEAGVDLQLSGHTHAGQLFPLNLINKRIYEQYWGWLSRGKTNYYVSCGVGTWGPPVRTGSVPEIVRIRISFAALS